MRQPAPDGSLLTWQEIESAYPWTALLVGNGLSINVWDGFGYSSLYTEALRTGALSKQDQALFEGLGTQNFERVLADLGASIRVLDALKDDTARLLAKYQSVQAALGEAIRSVHIPWLAVPAETLATIQRVLHEYEWVFTLNYDLLLYWAMGHDDDYGRLVDCLWGPKCRFNPADAEIRVGNVPVFFLHGAMHLIVEGSGRIRKLKRTAALKLLDQFGKPIPGDPRARPLMVTEGSWRDKLQAIEANEYLAHAFETLQAPYLDVPMVVFGCSLGEQDRHLTNALSEHPNRPIAVSMMPGLKRDLRRKQGDIFGRVEASPLLFFDATTYPLGAKNLAPVRP